MACFYCEAETESFVCAECLERDFISCDGCGVWVHKDEIHKVRNSHNREAYVCDDCLRRNFTSCDNCGVWVPHENLHRVRNSHNREAYVCDDCCQKVTIKQ